MDGTGGPSQPGQHSLSQLQTPLTYTELHSTGAPLPSGGVREGLRSACRRLAPHPAAVLAFVVVLLAFLLTRAVMQWQIRPER